MASLRFFNAWVAAWKLYFGHDPADKPPMIADQIKPLIKKLMGSLVLMKALWTDSWEMQCNLAEWTWLLGLRDVLAEPDEPSPEDLKSFMSYGPHKCFLHNGPNPHAFP